MSDGRRSLVNWIRRNVPPSAPASARASVVLPTPGMSSIKRWPRARSVTTAARIASGLPRITVAIASSSFRTAPMSVDESGASVTEPPDGAGTAGMFDEYSLSPAAHANAETPLPDVGSAAPSPPRRTTPNGAERRSPTIELHQHLEHVPEQRRDRRDQHQLRRDVGGGREVAHHQARLIEDVARHQKDHRTAEEGAEAESE